MIKQYLITSDDIIQDGSQYSLEKNYKSFNNFELLKDFYEKVLNINYCRFYDDKNIISDDNGIELINAVIDFTNNVPVFIKLYKHLNFIALSVKLKELGLNSNEILALHINHKTNSIYNLNFNSNYKLIDTPPVNFFNNIDNLLTKLILNV